MLRFNPKIHSSLFFHDSISRPNDTARHQLVRKQAEFGGGFGGRVAGDIEHGGDASAAVGDGDGQVADFIDEAGAEHGAVEFAATLKHELLEFEGLGEFAEDDFQIDFFLAAE